MPNDQDASLRKAYREWKEDTEELLEKEGWSDDAIDEVVRQEYDSVFGKKF